MAALAPGGGTGKVDGRGPKESASTCRKSADALQPRRRACLPPSVKAGVRGSGGPGSEQLPREWGGAVWGAELSHLFPTSLPDHARGRADPTRVGAAASAAGP